MRTSDLFLKDLLNRNNIFIHVCMSEELLSLKRQLNMNIIINLQKPNLGGSHWTALCIKNNNCFYFDSFGGVPDDYVIKFCKKKNRL